jgi:hypothetical protein
MKVLNLRCANGHGFEGWFASDNDYMGQNGRGLIECPLCADKVIARLPAAPRLNLSGARQQPAVAEAPAERHAAKPMPPRPADLQAAWLNTVRHLMTHTEDVGERFTEEARRIHYGEGKARGIRGQASPEQRAALDDEGIQTLSIPVPAALTGPVQ